MSEAKVIDNDNDNNDTMNSNDESLLLSYINEALTIIPDKYIDDAKLGIHNHHHIIIIIIIIIITGIEDALNEIKLKSLKVNKNILTIFNERIKSIG